jgi:hypothetical protein
LEQIPGHPDPPANELTARRRGPDVSPVQAHIGERPHRSVQYAGTRRSLRRGVDATGAACAYGINRSGLGALDAVVKHWDRTVGPASCAQARAQLTLDARPVHSAFPIFIARQHLLVDEDKARTDAKQCDRRHQTLASD